MCRVLAFLMIIGLLTGGASAVALDTEGLVGAWLLDEGKGNILTDSSGNGLDGEIVSGKTKWVQGQFEGGLEFDGNGMAQVPDNDLLDLESFTLAAWVNVPKISGKWQIIASKENRGPTGRNYGLFGNINTGVVHYSFTTNSGWKSFDAKTPITDGKWHHVAGTYQAPDFRMYLDGEVDAETAPATDPDNHDNVLFIGGCDIGDYWMTGTIDELVLFNRALAPAEITELMNDGLAVGLPVQPKEKLVTTWGRLKDFK